MTDMNTGCTITFWERQHTCTFHKILQKQTQIFGVTHDQCYTIISPHHLTFNKRAMWFKPVNFLN